MFYKFISLKIRKPSTSQIKNNGLEFRKDNLIRINSPIVAGIKMNYFWFKSLFGMCPKVNSILCNYSFESTKHRLKPPQCCNFDRWNDKTKTMDQHVLKPKICRHSPVESMMNKSNFIREQTVYLLTELHYPTT